MNSSNESLHQGRDGKSGIAQSSSLSPLNDYLEEKRRLLAERYPADCLTIARDIAARLVGAGRRPAIYSLSKAEQRERGLFYYPLMPERYGGRVTFTKHYVCCCDGLAYDPILEEPVAIEAYSQAVFGVDFPMRLFVGEEEMADYLEGRR